jgi:hypothetical protein
MGTIKAGDGGTIITSTCKVWLADDGIVRSDMLPDANETLETAKENVKAGIKVAGGNKRPLLLDMSKISSMNKEARDYYAMGDKRDSSESAVALLISSPLSRVIGNFFMGLNKPVIPTKLFNDKELALAWLKTFRT